MIKIILRDVRENNIPGLRRILVCIKGAVMGAYSTSYHLQQHRIQGKRQVRRINYFL